MRSSGWGRVESGDRHLYAPTACLLYMSCHNALRRIARLISYSIPYTAYLLHILHVLSTVNIDGLQAQVMQFMLLQVLYAPHCHLSSLQYLLRYLAEAHSVQKA